MAKSRRDPRSSQPRPLTPRPRSSREPLEPIAEWQSAAADAGVPVEQLMREVAQFRVALDADMTIAAAAAELGDDEWASSIIGSERQHLAEFEARALRALPAHGSPEQGQHGVFHGRRPRVLAAAAAAALIITGLGTAASRSDHRPNATASLALAAATRYADFTRLASGDVSAQQMIAAASALHDSLANLIMKDPTAAEQVATILSSEQQQLLRYMPAGTTIVLRDARELVARLARDVPSAAEVISSVDIESPPPSASPHPQASAHPTSKPSPKPTSNPTPQPSPTTGPASVPHPTPTPHPTSTAHPHPHPTSTPDPSASPDPSGTPIFPSSRVPGL